jgi:hypothetical protein
LKIYHLIARLLEINTIQFGLEPFTFLFHLSFLKVSTLFKKRQNGAASTWQVSGPSFLEATRDVVHIRQQ